jgi:lipoate-protein ligase A
LIYLNLPPMHWDETQLLYHALGRLGMEALALVRTIEPYVCVGFSQGIPVEVDADYCRRNDIGVFRREIGGGTVFIDRDQLLIQLVLRRDREDVPAGQANFFRKFLGPVVESYREIGINAEFLPVNDLLVGGKKVSGTGGGEVGECNVLATNILLDFDFEAMADALRCPSEEFRAAARRMMEENLTTVKLELGRIPPAPGLRETVRKRYVALLGPMEPSELPYQVEAEMERIRVELFHRRWVSDRGARKKWREVKIREGCYVAQMPGGKGEILLEISDGKIRTATGLGIPNGKEMTGKLIGMAYDGEQIINTISRMATR